MLRKPLSCWNNFILTMQFPKKITKSAPNKLQINHNIKQKTHL